MKGEARKAAIAAYKERKVVAGIYLVRCLASGGMWIGHWPDISTIQTRLWFTLRQDVNPNRELLDAWRRHGEAAFTFEVVEEFKDEAPSYGRAAELRDRASYWRDRFGADAL